MPTVRGNIFYETRWCSGEERAGFHEHKKPFIFLRVVAQFMEPEFHPRLQFCEMRNWVLEHKALDHKHCSYLTQSGTNSQCQLKCNTYFAETILSKQILWWIRYCLPALRDHYSGVSSISHALTWQKWYCVLTFHADEIYTLRWCCSANLIPMNEKTQSKPKMLVLNYLGFMKGFPF